MGRSCEKMVLIYLSVTIKRLCLAVAMLNVLASCCRSSIAQAPAKRVDARFGSYNAFGDSIAEGCCVSGGTITESSIHNNVATLTVVSGESQPIPVVGDLLTRVTGTAIAGGALNFTTETPVTAVGGGFRDVHTYNGQSGSVTGTISFAFRHADAPSTPEHGSFRAATYVSHVASVLGLPAGNRSRSGTTCADMGPRVFKMNVPVTGNALYTLEDGVNDIGSMNGGSPPKSHIDAAALEFVRCAQAEDIFLATPTTSIVLAKDAAAHAASWRPSTLKDPDVGKESIEGGVAPAFEMMSDIHGASFTASVQGTAIVVGYEATPAGSGTARVSVDGGREITIVTLPLCLDTASNRVSLVRHGDMVTAAGSSLKMQPNSWLLVRDAADASFNGAFVLRSVSEAGITWMQKAVDATTSAQIAVNTCSLSQPKFGRTFIPQAAVLSGLPDTAHKVTITVTSPSGEGRTVYIDYIAGNHGAGAADGPTVVRTGVERTKSRWMSDEVTGIWNDALKQGTYQLSSLGWNIKFADVRARQSLFNGGNVAPYMFAEMGGTGTFSANSNRVTNVDPALIPRLGVGWPIDDAGHYLPPGSKISMIEKDGFSFASPIEARGALATGQGYFDIFAGGVHPNHRGQKEYFAAAILQTLGLQP